MASSFDLAPRLARLQAQGLTVTSDYHGKPAKWLQHALDDCDARVVNCRGAKADDTIVLVRLSMLEELVELNSRVARFARGEITELQLRAMVEQDRRRKARAQTQTQEE